MELRKRGEQNATFSQRSVFAAQAWLKKTGGAFQEALQPFHSDAVAVVRNRSLFLGKGFVLTLL